MPKVSIKQPQIVIEIPDLQIGETIFKRKAFFFDLKYNQDKEFLIVAWTVKHYAKNPDNSYGEYLGQFVPDKIRESIADDTTIVHAETGEIITDLEQYKEIILVDGETIPEHQVPDMEIVDGVEQQKVDAEGNPVFITVPAHTPQVEQIVDNSPPYCGQYEWFTYVGEYVDVKINDMIRQYGLQTNWFEKLK